MCLIFKKLTELDNRILDFQKKIKILDPKTRKYFHIKSIENISEHLLHESNNSGRLQKISITRKKELLLDYLQIILDENSKKSSKFYYDNYVSKLGRFMNSYYGFTYCGGKILILFLSIYILIGFVIDFIIYTITNNFYYVFILTLLFGSSRAIIKYKKNQVYGPEY